MKTEKKAQQNKTETNQDNYKWELKIERKEENEYVILAILLWGNRTSPEPKTSQLSVGLSGDMQYSNWAN